MTFVFASVLCRDDAIAALIVCILCIFCILPILLQNYTIFTTFYRNCLFTFLYPRSVDITLSIGQPSYCDLL